MRLWTVLDLPGDLGERYPAQHQSEQTSHGYGSMDATLQGDASRGSVHELASAIGQQCLGRHTVASGHAGTSMAAATNRRDLGTAFVCSTSCARTASLR